MQLGTKSLGFACQLKLEFLFLLFDFFFFLLYGIPSLLQFCFQPFDFLLLLNRWGACPPPLPTETGACCTAFGPCITMTEIRCELTLGTYLGDGSTCNGMACPDQP